jgi:hypothetical protein
LTLVEKAKEIFLSLWIISWFAFIGAFLWVGTWEFRIALSAGSDARYFCLVLLTTTILLWILLFAAESKAARGGADTEKAWRAYMLLFTVAGTILAIHTLEGILFFIYIAPRVH